MNYFVKIDNMTKSNTISYILLVLSPIIYIILESIFRSIVGIFFTPTIFILITSFLYIVKVSFDLRMCLIIFGLTLLTFFLSIGLLLPITLIAPLPDPFKEVYFIVIVFGFSSLIFSLLIASAIKVIFDFKLAFLIFLTFLAPITFALYDRYKDGKIILFEQLDPFLVQFIIVIFMVHYIFGASRKNSKSSAHL